MTRSILSLILTPILALAASAQMWEPYPLDMNGPLTGPADFSMKANQDAAKAKRAAALSSTLVAMNDGVEVGSLIVSYIKRNKVDIQFKKIDKLSWVWKGHDPSWDKSVEPRGPTIFLNEALLPYPRVYAPHIARQTAELITQDMLDTAERRYMTLSLEVRSWIELGGDPKALPVIEHLAGYKDEGSAKRFKLWLDNDSQTALHRIGEETMTSTIPEAQGYLAQSLKDPSIIEGAKEVMRKFDAQLERDNTRFVDFLIAESLWKRMYPGK